MTFPLDDLFNALPDMVFLVDSKGVFLDCNEHADLLMPRAEVIGRQFADICPADVAAQCMGTTAQALASGASQIFEYSLVLATCPAHFEARFQRVDSEKVLLIIRNVTKQVVLKQDLEQARRLSEVIARAQSCFIREADRRKAFDGLLADCLQLTQSEYGFIGEVLNTPEGKPYLKTYAITNISWSDETRAFYEANAPQGLLFTNLKTLFGVALTSGQVVIANDPAHHPARGGVPHGHPPLDRFLCIPIYHADKMVAMLGVANRNVDYDDQLVVFLEPLMVTIGQLVVAAWAERLKDEFVATVSHELRTPLTSIGGSLGLLSGGVMGALPADAERLLQIAHSNCQRLTYLINDLLDMEKITAGKIGFACCWQPLEPLIQQAIESLTSYVNGLQCVVEGEHSFKDWDVYTDGQRFVQILTNYLSNAAKFSPPNLPISLLFKPAEDDLWVGVRDQGPGIPPDFKSRLFEKFAQADGSTTRRSGGTGLGLAISRALAEGMGGAVGCDSQPGSGATFWVRQRARRSVRDGLPAENARRCLNVLVVEDEPDVAYLLTTLLSNAGHTVMVARTASDAMVHLAEQTFDVMTLDWCLPDIRGGDVIRYIRKRLRLLAMPIIVLSARQTKDAELLETEEGLLRWLAKPVDEQRLCDLLDGVVCSEKGVSHEN